MEIDHFSHDHPLILNEEHKHDGVEVKVPCYGCVRPISGPSYDCTQCQFFLHKSCAELPREMIHPSHPEHPLTLLPNRPSYYGGGCICDICRKGFNRFIYQCSQCKFDVDINCASMVHSVRQTIEHPSHKHRLIPLQTPAMFLCHACGTKHEGSSYLCTTCGFWVNQNCASLPSTIKLGRHHHRHPLTLVHSVPHECYQFRPKCKICDKRVYRNSWVYYCSECSYFAHANCATSETQHSADCKIEIHQLQDLDSVVSGIAIPNTDLSKNWKLEAKAEVLQPNLLALPVADESVDLRTQFMRKIIQGGKYNEATEISHVSHDHPLIFSHKQIDDESFSGSKLPLLNEDEDEKCNGCAQTISISAAPFYRCAQCKFNLHQWCAELPNELRHPCHPEHPLRLITQQSTELHLYRCRCCRLICNTFIFGCSACKFYIDSKCAYLPRLIRHEAHKHTLALRQTQSDTCSACKSYCPEFAYVCDSCNLNICIRCALLPRTVRHRYDKHPFTLTYAALEGQVDEDFCEICLGDIECKYWFYHCVECDQSLHPKCIRPVDENSNLKHPVSVNSDEYHPHLLSYVRSPNGNSPCGRCGEPFRSYDIEAFECGACNFWIHYFHVIG